MSKWLDNTNKWMDAPKKWERGSEKWLENSEMILVQDDLNSGLADAADSLAANSLVMDYYSHFESGKYHFFFSPNPHLELATKKPKQFSSWDDWDNILSQNQKKTLAVLGGFKEDATDIIRNENHLNKLKEAYIKWPKELYSIWWGNEFSGTWTCNIFVGDAIYLWKKKSITNSNKHYYSPSQIAKGEGSFKEIKKDNVDRGAIVVFGTSHMEIVTSRERNKYLDDGFCSIGAGRGTRSSTGTVRCDNIWGDKREIENKNNHFYSI